MIGRLVAKKQMAKKDPPKKKGKEIATQTEDSGEDAIYKQARELLRKLAVDGELTKEQEKSWKLQLKAIYNTRNKGTEEEYHKKLRAYMRELKKAVK